MAQQADNVKMEMKHIQRMSPMGIIGAMSTTPTVVLENLPSIFPNEMFTDQEALTTFLRLSTVNCWQQTAYDHLAVLTKNLNRS